MYKLSHVIMASLAMAGFSIAHAQAPDNTKQNATESRNRTESADKQKNNKADLSLVQQIRKGVIADKSLSTDAHNVKIVALNGNVTLNGVVRSDAEKSAIQVKAQAVVRDGSVTNNLKVSQ